MTVFAITRGRLSLWRSAERETSPCQSCGRGTRWAWETETGLICIRACRFACAATEYRRRLNLDHADGYHNGMTHDFCPLCEVSTGGPAPRTLAAEIHSR